MKALQKIIPHLAALAVISGCAWLASWQIERAEFKRELIDRHESMSTLSLNETTAVESLPIRISATGRWHESRQVLLDNQVLDGQAGVFVLTPFELPDGRIFLVNRGWAAWLSRQEDPPNPPVESPDGTVTGILNEPPRVGRRPGGHDALAGDSWPLLATWYEHAELTSHLGAQLRRPVIQLAPEHPAHLTGRPWVITSFGPERHLGYALTWATMAVTVFIIWLALSVRSRRGGKNRKNKDLQT